MLDPVSVPTCSPKRLVLTPKGDGPAGDSKNLFRPIDPSADFARCSGSRASSRNRREAHSTRITPSSTEPPPPNTPVRHRRRWRRSHLAWFCSFGLAVVVLIRSANSVGLISSRGAPAYRRAVWVVSPPVPTVDEPEDPKVPVHEIYATLWPTAPYTPISGLQPTPSLEGAETNRVEGDCIDGHPSCRLWAARGECRRNPRYMRVSCQLSCHRCPLRATTALSFANSSQLLVGLHAANGAIGWLSPRSPSSGFRCALPPPPLVPPYAPIRRRLT